MYVIALKGTRRKRENTSRLLIAKIMIPALHDIAKQIKLFIYFLSLLQHHGQKCKQGRIITNIISCVRKKCFFVVVFRTNFIMTF